MEKTMGQWDKNNSIKNYIAENRSEMFRFLEKLVCINSGSRNKAGVDRVGQTIESVLRNNTVVCEQITRDAAGNHLIFRTPPAKNSADCILIVGHMDTVFPEDTDFIGYREDTKFLLRTRSQRYERRTGDGHLRIKGS
jgi:glutamate carboxypeptidase